MFIHAMFFYTQLEQKMSRDRSQGAEGNSMFILSLGLAQAGRMGGTTERPWIVHWWVVLYMDYDGLSIINCPFDSFFCRIVHEINHPAIGDPPFMEPTDKNGQ